MNNQKLSIIGLLALLFATGMFIYPQMPSIIATHWGIDGQADGFTGKFWGLFLLPLIAALIAALLLFIPKIDPLKQNYAQFQKQYDRLALLFTGFVVYLYFLTIAWNLGSRFDMTRMIIPAFAVLFYYIGVVLEKAKRNWFVGIRTPWTISSDAVWNKTNKLGATIFKLFGVASLLGIFFGGTYFFWLIAAIVIASLYLFVYSYLEFKKENNR